MGGLPRMGLGGRCHPNHKGKAETAGELTEPPWARRHWTVLEITRCLGFSRLLACVQAPAHGWGDSSLPGALGAGLLP